MKKFLSLVLALIMTMSLVTISAGATEYKDLTDKDEIEYEEAVAVLNRIGVITGYEDGSFRPETELTRGAAAKIIVSLLIGPEAASNLPNATAPYPDVPASHTFAGVISYCKTAKIISGYGDGTFKPGNSLTGFAFAKMLLGALGYSSEIEGFVDTGWTMNVAKVGNVAGLFDRLDFDGAGAVNRETACQLALNTLKATEVTYGGTTLVTGAQTLAVANTQAMYKTSNNREINANINRRVISAQNNELTLEFGEEHFKDLRLEHDKYDPAYDDYGHPSNEWSWKKVTIGTFKLPADFTYTTQISYREDSVATKEKALGLRGYDTYSTDHRAAGTNWSSASNTVGWNSPFDDATQITINGWDARVESAATGTLVNYDASKITNKDGAPTLAEIADLTDNGVTVEVYVCPVDADFITNVVVTRTQMMEVKRIGSDYVTLDRISPDSRDPRKDADLPAITGYNAYAIDVDTLDVKDNNFDAYEALKGLKSGDKVAVIPFTADQGKTWEVGEAYVPETVSGKLSDVGLYMNTSKRDGNATSITVGGTKYVINEWNLDMIDVKKAQINATRKDVTAYLASDGTVLWATEIGNSDAWMIVGDYYQAANTSGKVVWFAHGWTIGGEEVDVDLGTIRGEAEKYAPGELVHYALADGGTGEYKLEKPNVTGRSRLYGTGAPSAWSEPIRKDDKDRATGEGIYNVAQFVQNAGGNAEYEIHPANSLIPLEKYSNAINSSLRPEYNAVGGKIFGNEDATTNPHSWDYRSTTYKNDGVKFIYVSFDATTGNVDYVSVRKDAQSVDHDELTQMNTRWNNVGTNVNNQNWVISPAEAYVNDEGNVEAVVIKCEPAVADLSNVVIVGEYVGAEYGKTGAETSATNPGNSSAREYWQGPNFNEKKTGYFKNGHNVGDIVVIRSTDSNNVMDCKLFNGGIFENRNPDVFASKGIAALKSAADATSKIAFYVGNSTGYTVKSQDLLTNLTSANAEFMTDMKVEADDLGDLNELNEHRGYAGLVKVAGAKWIDLRANRGSNEVENLSDLLDLDPATVELHVLLNAKGSTDNFRRAYAIVVLAGTDKQSVATPGTMSMRMVDNANFTYIAPVSGSGTATSPWVFEVETLGQNVTLQGLLSASASIIDSQSWAVNEFSMAADSSNRITFTAPTTADGVRNVRWTVHVHDADKDIKDSSATRYAQVKIKSAVEYADVAITNVDPAQTVTFTAAGYDTVTGTTTAKLVKGVTYTATVAEGYTVAPATVVAGTTATVVVTKDEEPTGTKEITVTGVEGAEVAFKNQAGETVVTATVGTPANIPTGVYLTAEAVDSANHALACKNVGTEPVPFAAYFKAENVDSVRVYVKGTGRVPSAAWDADASNGGNGLTFIPAETSAAAAAEVLAETSVQSAPAASETIIKVTTSAGDAYLAAPTTGLNAGLYTLITADDSGNACPATIAQVVTALVNGAVAEDVASRDDVVYGDEPTPVDPSETVKAKWNTDKYEIYSYAAEAVTEEDAIAAVLAAQNKRVEGGTATYANTSYNAKTGVLTFDVTNNGTTAKAQTVSIATGTAKNSGSMAHPKPLYKVTVGDAEAVYVEEGGQITSVTEGTFIRESDVWTTNKVIADELTGVTFATAMLPDDDADGNKVYDAKLVPATLITGDATASAIGTDTAGTLNAQGQVQFGTGAVKTISDLDTTLSTNYIAIGAKLTLYVNLAAESSKTFVVNGTQFKAENTGSTAAAIKLDPITVALNDDDAFVISAEDRIQIKLNGELLTNTDGTTLFDGAPSALKLPGDPSSWTGLSLAKVSKEGLSNEVASANVAAISIGAVEATADVSGLTATAGVLELYSGYTVGKPSANYTISNTRTSGSTGSVTVANGDTNAAFVTCKPGATPVTLYVTGPAATVIGYEAEEDARKISDLTVVTEPTKTTGGTWSFKATGAVVFTTEFKTTTYTAPSVSSYTAGPTVNLNDLTGTKFTLDEVTYTYAPKATGGKFTAVTTATAFGGALTAPTVTLAGEDDTSAASTECGTMTITAKHGEIVFTVTQAISTTGTP